MTIHAAVKLDDARLLCLLVAEAVPLPTRLDLRDAAMSSCGRGEWLVRVDLFGLRGPILLVRLGPVGRD